MRRWFSIGPSCIVAWRILQNEAKTQLTLRTMQDSALRATAAKQTAGEYRKSDLQITANARLRESGRLHHEYIYSNPGPEKIEVFYPLQLSRVMIYLP